MKPAMDYIEQAINALSRLRKEQCDNIEAAAQELAKAVKEGKTIYSFGASHSFILTEEMVYRTGGLMLVNPIYPHGMNLFIRPITLTSQLERVEGLGQQFLDSVKPQQGDVLLIASTSGRNCVAIDMAKVAQEKGVKVIGITSLAYTDGVSSRHSTGKKVKDFCDIVIDNCAPYGDASVAIQGFEQKAGPLSTVTGCAIVNQIAVSVVRILVEQGIEPPVFMSANLDGGDAYNKKHLEANKDRIKYL